MKKHKVLFLQTTVLFGMSFFTGLFAGGCAHTSKPSVEAQVPVQKVVLYKNGVGYFERRGKIDESHFELQVRPEQINDILKSLTVIDLHQGKAVSVNFPLEDYSAKRLAEFPAQVTGLGGLFSFLDSLKGAQIRITGKKGNVQGRVIGPESYSSLQGLVWMLSLREDSGALINYPYLAIEKVYLEDAQLRVALENHLDLGSSAKNWRPVTVSVQLEGSQPHDLLMSYITEMPVWKPAYRLVLKDEKPLLQGWVVVDNVSGEDWNDVTLSFVAGSPLSFKYDLHSPQFKNRVDLTPKSNEYALAPQMERSGYAEEPVEEKEVMDMSYAAKPTRPTTSAGIGAMKKSRARRDSKNELLNARGAFEGNMLKDQFGSQAQGESMGALFRYDLNEPITVKDRTSALVSIVNQQVRGEEIVLFQNQIGSYYGKSTPYRAVLLQNDTPFTLEKGPITIYSGGALVGEGFIDRMAEGASNFITFAMDDEVWMTSKQTNGERANRLLKIVGGMIQSEVLQTYERTFTVENKRSEKITAYIKVPNMNGWRFQNKPKKTVETPEALFLPVDVPAKKKKEVDWVWSKPIKKTLAIQTDLSTEVLRLFLEEGQVPSQIKEPIQKILDAKMKMLAIQTEERKENLSRLRLENDQNRVRENLNLLRKTKGNAKLQKELTQKLAKLEKQLGDSSSKLVQLSEEKAQLENQMRVLIQQISFENKEK